MELKKILEKRHCSRKFRAKKVGWNDLSLILDSARYAPCAGGIFTIKLIVVDNDEKKKKLAEAALGQSFIAEAPYIIIVCSDMERIKSSYGNFAEKYASQQAGAAIENMFLKATELGLSTCWIGTFDENAIKRIMHIPDKAKVEALLPVGYEMEKSFIKEKISLKRIVRFNDWENKELVGWKTKATSKE